MRYLPQQIRKDAKNENRNYTVELDRYDQAIAAAQQFSYDCERPLTAVKVIKLNDADKI